MMYTAHVYCTLHGDERWSAEKEGFATVKGATSWVSDIFAQVMLNWGKLDENGVSVSAEITDADEFEGFCDTHELRCGC